jgi:hypothetical protein
MKIKQEVPPVVGKKGSAIKYAGNSNFNDFSSKKLQKTAKNWLHIF